MEKNNLDEIILRENAIIPDLPEINQSLLKIISAPLYGKAKEDFYEAFYDENQYYNDIIEKKGKKKKQITDFIRNLNPEDSIYQLNSKALNSIDEYPELSQGRIEDVFDFSENYDKCYDEDDEYYVEDNYYEDDEYYVEDDGCRDEENYGEKDENCDEENCDEKDECSEIYSNILLHIQNNYERAISRHSDYSVNLKRHIASGNGLVYSPFVNDESVLVGLLKGDIFFVSHFAPSSIKMGYRLINQSLNSRMPIVFAVPEFLAKQLRKVGFRDLGFKIPQIFNGKIVEKNVLINNAVTEDDLKGLMEEFSNDYLGLSI